MPALDGLDLEIGDGELMVLLGPSGSGKTTVLRMSPGSRSRRRRGLIGGRVVNDDAPERRDVAMVFQNYALYPHLTVADNIAFPLRVAQGAEGASARRGCARPRSARAHASWIASPGALRRAAPARGHGARDRARAAVFLIDEPLSNLDAKLRVQMRAEMRSCRRGSA